MDNILIYHIVDESSYNILAKKIEDGVFQLLESSFLSEEHTYGCVVKTIEKDGKFYIDKIIKHSNYKTEMYILSEEFIQSEPCQKFLNKLESIGGNWDVAMKGLLSIYIPENSNFNPEIEFNKIKE